MRLYLLEIPPAAESLQSVVQSCSNRFEVGFFFGVCETVLYKHVQKDSQRKKMTHVTQPLPQSQGVFTEVTWLKTSTEPLKGHLAFFFLKLLLRSFVIPFFSVFA